MSVYCRGWNSVVYIVGDNCSLNKAMATKTMTDLVGCASRRLNLAIKIYLQDDEAITNKVY